jgi:hypothetical protein
VSNRQVDVGRGRTGGATRKCRMPDRSSGIAEVSRSREAQLGVSVDSAGDVGIVVGQKRKMKVILSGTVVLAVLKVVIVTSLKCRGRRPMVVRWYRVRWGCVRCRRVVSSVNSGTPASMVRVVRGVGRSIGVGGVGKAPASARRCRCEVVRGVDTRGEVSYRFLKGYRVKREQRVVFGFVGVVDVVGRC